MNPPSTIEQISHANYDLKSHYINHLETSSAYYTAKKNAKKAWINGDNKGIENARIKFSHYLYQIDYQMNHFSQGQNLSMAGLHQSCINILKQAISKASTNLNLLQQKRLDRICNEFDMPVSRTRNLRDQELLLDDKDGLFTAITEIYPDLQMPFDGLPSQSGKRFERLCFYDDSDIFDGLKSISISMQNSFEKIFGKQNEEAGRDFWSAFSIPIRTVSLAEITEIFKELHPNEPQVGIDSDKMYFDEIDIRIDNILKKKSIKNAQQLAKSGIPSGSRAQIWDLILQTDFVDDLKDYSITYCRRLTEVIASTELVHDRLLLIDAKHSQNDESYFVFEEILNKTILYWSRDSWYFEKINQLKTSDSALLENRSIGFPPNGMYPIWGISLYAMPICFIYDNSSSIYFTFRELYGRFFTHLHTFSDRTDNILYLCIAFENLLKQSDSHLFFHLQFNLDFQPLSIAYRWILYGFVGVLSPDQVLLLWDKMIGYDSCLIFSVMAAAIFTFRKEELLSAKCEQDVLNHMSDLMNLETVPVLQEFIFNRF